MSFPALSAGAPTLLRNSAYMSTPYRPMPDTKEFRKRLVRRLESAKPADNSAKSKLRYASFRFMDKVNGLFKDKPVVVQGFSKAPPPSRAPTIRTPWIYITMANDIDPAFRPIRRQTRVASGSGTRSVREAARARREAARDESSFKPDEFSLLQSPEHALLYKEINKLLTPPLGAEAPADWKPKVEGLPSLFADCGSDNGSVDDPFPETPVFPDGLTAQIKDLVLQVGALNGRGNDLDTDFQTWLLASTNTMWRETGLADVD